MSWTVVIPFCNLYHKVPNKHLWVLSACLEIEGVGT